MSDFNERNTEAIVRVFKTAGDGGAFAAIEELADFCNGIDLVDDETIAWYEAWVRRHKQEQAAIAAKDARIAKLEGALREARAGLHPRSYIRSAIDRVLEGTE